MAESGRRPTIGRTWKPIFDQQPTGSIGAIEVAPSDPNIIYVGSGEGLHRPDLSVGDGIYKSTDAGTTWTHLGLRDGQQISQMAVDPRDPNRLFVAVAGHPYGPNPERGIYRSTDGGQSFEKVLYKDENIGGNDVKIDPSDSERGICHIVGGARGTVGERRMERDRRQASSSRPMAARAGSSWRADLPSGIVQAYVVDFAQQSQSGCLPWSRPKARLSCTAPTMPARRWTTVTSDPRPKMRIGGGDLPVPGDRSQESGRDVRDQHRDLEVHRRRQDVDRIARRARAATTIRTSGSIRTTPKIILLTSDQGAIVTVNGGQSWSSWYNQPTAQLYHVNADNAFPYRLCSGQQESGSVCISSRGNDGEITFRDWHPVAAEEYGYVVPDPLDPDIVYGGKLSRYDRRTAQAQNIMPVPLRSGRTFASFAPSRSSSRRFDPHLMYFAANTLWATRDGGQSWKQVSPDLTRKTFEVPATVGVFSSEPSAQPRQRGVIYALALSPVDSNRIWAGTDDGLIWITTDGGTNWKNVTPPQLSPWQKVSVLEASHTDPQTAYAAINTLRLDDLRPHIYRTHDGGKTWTEIVSGIPADENVNSVREDPKRKGLLFAGTERAVYVSFDDGDHWQSLRLNMPATSVRDLLIKDNDLAVATHGRGFWILDDITPLRQM